MEIALENVSVLEGKIFVFPDVSGSMHSPVTGYRKGAASAVRCIDAAALLAAALLRKNNKTIVLPFHDRVVKRQLNGRDTVMTNANRLASIPCGGTNCSAPLRYLNKKKETGDMIIYISDNQSWIDTNWKKFIGNDPTKTMNEWMQFKKRNPQAKMICIDVQPYATTQAPEQKDIINIAGFSDHVFSLIASASADSLEENFWVNHIESIDLKTTEAA